MKRTNKIEITEAEIKESIVDFLEKKYATNKDFTYRDIANVIPTDVELLVHTTVEGNNVTHECTAKIEIVTDF